MKKILLLAIILAACISHSRFALAQDTSLFRYLPLRVGNVWVYYGSGWFGGICGTASWYDRYRLTSTTVINGRTFFTFSHTRVMINGTCSGTSRLFSGDFPIRIDSLTMNIYKSTNCGSSSQLLVDSLRARLHDSSLTCDAMSNRSVCSDTTLYNICGSSRQSKAFGVAGPEWSSSQRYVKNVGLVYVTYYWGASYTINLRGAVTDGVLCGDTSMPVGIQIISSEIPNEFHLYQNYPNPFNPTTRIRFDVPQAEAIHELSLRVFDALGREVAILINEPLQPGSYEVEWNAGNFPSGIYYYTLQAGEFSQSKKLILLK